MLAESLRMIHKNGALRSQDLKRATVDTTVQPKNISFPTDAKLPHAAIKGLNRLAGKHGVPLRQSYLRVAKRAAMMAGRIAHAKQFNRHRRELRIQRTRLGRPIRDIGRKIAGQERLPNSAGNQRYGRHDPEKHQQAVAGPGKWVRLEHGALVALKCQAHAGVGRSRIGNRNVILRVCCTLPYR